jgi:hypothetical protein
MDRMLDAVDLANWVRLFRPGLGVVMMMMMTLW